MRRFLLLFGIMVLSSWLMANNYRVEVGVFERSVGTDYFYGLQNVKWTVDVNDLYRYYLGDFETLKEAEAAKADAISKGYRARIVDMEAERLACATACKPQLYVENIFFDFDQSYLRTQSKRDLDELALLLEQNPGYKVELSAHTDSRGSLEYNIALSKRRANAAKDFLLSRGISADRIMTSEFGETSPIAKNDLNGKDSPDGRQFNRRVVVTVMDSSGKIIDNVVKPIDVPGILKAN